jgi:hypothetical protein
MGFVATLKSIGILSRAPPRVLRQQSSNIHLMVILGKGPHNLHFMHMALNYTPGGMLELPFDGRTPCTNLAVYAETFCTQL